MPRTESQRIGRLRHRVTIEMPVRIQTEGGAAQETWLPLETVFAELCPRDGRERVRGDQLDAEVTHVVRMRFRDDLNEDMRLTMPGRTFEITAVIDEGEMRRWVKLLCIERRA
ncbi:MAG: phage head closure protein [Pseudomonadota bacterium]